MRIALSIACLSIIAGCAAPDQQVALLKPTASGFAEGTAAQSDVAAIRSRIIERCAAHGSTVQETGVQSVTCSRVLQGMQAVAISYGMGNAYSTAPEGKTQFLITQSGSDVRVVAQSWVELQMPGGQVRRQNVTDAKTRNYTQTFLRDEIGAY